MPSSIVSVEIGADLSGTNILISFLDSPPWLTEHEVGLPVGETTATEIDPKSQEAFDGRKRGAMTIAAAAAATSAD